MTLPPEEREQVTVIPSVTRWFTSNGADTIHVKAGVPITVPENLAKQMIRAGYAEAVSPA